MLKLPLKKNIGISLLTNLIPPGDIYKEAQVKKYVEVIENKVDLIRNMSKEKLDQILSNMSFKNRSKVILLPNKIITKESD